MYARGHSDSNGQPRRAAQPDNPRYFRAGYPEDCRKCPYWKISQRNDGDEDNEEGFLMMESSSDLIFLQIWDAETDTAWACFDPELLESNEEAPITPSDGQSVFPLKCTMRDRELAAKCVEWYAHTCEPYPGMDWLKDTKE